MSGITDQNGPTLNISGQGLLIADLKELNLRHAAISTFVVSFRTTRSVRQNLPIQASQPLGEPADIVHQLLHATLGIPRIPETGWIL